MIEIGENLSDVITTVMCFFAATNFARSYKEAHAYCVSLKTRKW